MVWGHRRIYTISKEKTEEMKLEEQVHSSGDITRHKTFYQGNPASNIEFEAENKSRSVCTCNLLSYSSPWRRFSDYLIRLAMNTRAAPAVYRGEQFDYFRLCSRQLHRLVLFKIIASFHSLMCTVKYRSQNLSEELFPS